MTEAVYKFIWIFTHDLIRSKNILNCWLIQGKITSLKDAYSSLRKSKALDLSPGSWDKVLLLLLTEGVTWEVGALYFRFTGGSGFLVVLLEELKSLLKLKQNVCGHHVHCKEQSVIPHSLMLREVPECSCQAAGWKAAGRSQPHAAAWAAAHTAKRQNAQLRTARACSPVSCFHNAAEETSE